ncbi:hypothetical protein M405DRAFT_813207 [Rhizopogon salebrosus TDB-379]|nr:hypothetical protein M405DRAFT_813207 [Rhizopogon salebrosus TDB-379]
MTLLASSLRYWVVEKMNTDPGWKDLKLSYQMQVCPEKESIRLWISFADNARTMDMTLILTVCLGC